MTWIIGATIPTGYCFVLSDIKVSWGEHHENCLQKFYPLTPNMGLGFAGSVYIGLHIIKKCEQYLSEDVRRKILEPDCIAHDIRNIALDIYNRAPDEEKKIGSQLIFTGCSLNTVSSGIPFVWPKTYIAIYSARKEFNPDFAEPMKVVSIGSGSTTEEYKGLLYWLNEKPNELLKFDGNFDYGSSILTMLLATDKLTQYPNKDVSKYLQAFIFSRYGVREGNNDMKNGSIHKIKMPTVRKGYEQYHKFCKSKGLPVWDSMG